MLFSDLLSACGYGETHISEDFEVLGIASNVQDVQEGFVFVAVKGQKFDGADFAVEAFSRGAKGVVAERVIEGVQNVVLVEDVRFVLAQMADLVYPHKRISKLAVTGTNGKTSVAHFLRLFLALRYKSASIGTLGIVSDSYLVEGSRTTLDPVSLSKELQVLQKHKIDCVVMEASSHGLHQKRLHGQKIRVAGFTNLSRDHLDYHENMENYLKAKSILFSDLLEADGTAVLNADVPEFNELSKICSLRGIKVLSYGKKGVDLKLESLRTTPTGQNVCMRAKGDLLPIQVPIYGAFQAYNIMCAMLMARAMGVRFHDMWRVIEKAAAPAGRLEPIGIYNGGHIFVDYAHTPDAIEQVLKTLRPHTQNKLVCLMGCGGNRDQGKRPLMGKVAQANADLVYLTDDNPRFEQSDAILEDILQGIENKDKVVVISDRRKAIQKAVSSLSFGDVLVLCGKGHETGQLLNGVNYPFSDKNEVLLTLKCLKETPVWDKVSLEEALGVSVWDDFKATGVSIDTRSLVPGDLFLAFSGQKVDGHKYVYQAIEAGASACLVEHDVEGVQSERLIKVQNVEEALYQLARYSRKRSQALYVGVTGSSGKTTTKEMIKTCFQKFGKTSATVGNLNNELGVPITLARVPHDAQYVVVEMGMNHKGEISRLTEMVQPDISVITMIGTAHQGFFDTPDGIACAKAEIFEGQKKGGIAILNADGAYFELLKEKALARGLVVKTFGAGEDTDFRLIDYQAQQQSSFVKSYVQGLGIDYPISFLGKHFAYNSLAAFGAVYSAGCNLFATANALVDAKPVEGRGNAFTVSLSPQDSFVVINDCYNANPSSMEASLGVLSQIQAKRKVAILGEMRELGDQGVQLHEDLGRFVAQLAVDQVYTVGPMMRSLRDQLPEQMRAGHFDQVDESLLNLKEVFQAGDVVLVKGSNSVGLSKLIQVLQGK